MILKKQQPCSQAELARCLGLTPAGVTRFLPTYVEEGLVHSKVDSRQPRKNVLRLTPEGLAIAERCWAHLESEFATLLKECDVPVTEFVSFIDRLNEGLIAKQKGLKQ